MTPAERRLLEKLAARPHSERWVRLRGVELRVAWNTIERGHSWIDLRVGDVAKITDDGRRALATVAREDAARLTDTQLDVLQLIAAGRSLGDYVPRYAPDARRGRGAYPVTIASRAAAQLRRMRLVEWSPRARAAPSSRRLAAKRWIGETYEALRRWPGSGA